MSVISALRKAIVVLALSGIANRAEAQSASQSPPSPISGTVSIGAEYDSNVTIDETDVTSNRGDLAATVGGSLELKAIDSSAVKLRLTYSADATFYKEIKDFDLAIHQASARLAVDAGDATLGLDYRYIHVQLDKEGFLDLHFITPSVSGFVSKTVYARLAASFIRKSYKSSVDLDADTVQVSADVYRFFAGRQGYVALGYRHDRENTVGPAFDYRAMQASVRALVPFRVFAKPVKLRLSSAYSERDYRNITPSIGERRHEKRAMVTAELLVPLSKQLSFRPLARYVVRTSNVPIFDYHEQSFSLGLEYRF